MNQFPFDDNKAFLFDSITEYEHEVLMSNFSTAHKWCFKITACNHTLHIKRKMQLTDALTDADDAWYEG